MTPLLTIIRLESIKAQLGVAELILRAMEPAVRVLDQRSASHLEEAMKRVAGVREWLTTWQETLEKEQLKPPTRRLL